ncbi:MAG: PLD nuclease N-terminal domain-containing protein [Lachnospiraceae bacterium]
MMEILQEYWMILAPMIVLQLVLAVTALIHVLRHPVYRFGNRVIWIVVVLFVQIFGPIVYFAFGRGEE